jgi:hypothetical protein
MSNASSADLLWISVKNHLENKIGDSVKPNWKLISSDVAGCEICSEYGGGVLMKCLHDRCKREFHVDCAFHQGGLSLDEVNGNLSYQCTTHFKPVLFCICREKYDEFRAMICCDQCIEWYHCSCVGLQEEDAYNLEQYQCQSCSNLLEQNKPIPENLKEKNLDKEKLSSCHQTANKAVGHLVELAGTICPLIDLMNSGSRTKYPLDKVKEALDFLANDSKDNDPNQEIERFGTEDLVASWQKKLSDYYNRFMTWSSSLQALIMGCASDLKAVSLRDDFVESLASYVERCKQLDMQIQDFCFADVDFFVAFHESLLNIHDIFEVSQCWMRKCCALAHRKHDTHGRFSPIDHP